MTSEIPSLRWLDMQAGFMAPVIHPGRMRNAFQAMAVALFHAGSAVLQYSLIINQDSGQPERHEILRDRYMDAECEARAAHRLLHLVATELVDRHPSGLGPEMRKYCRQAHTRMTYKRSQAAALPGIDSPLADETISFDALDHVFDPVHDGNPFY